MFLQKPQTVKRTQCFTAPNTNWKPIAQFRSNCYEAFNMNIVPHLEYESYIRRIELTGEQYSPRALFVVTQHTRFIVHNYFLGMKRNRLDKTVLTILNMHLKLDNSFLNIQLLLGFDYKTFCDFFYILFICIDTFSNICHYIL